MTVFMQTGHENGRLMILVQENIQWQFLVLFFVKFKVFKLLI
jgi:hypothetical protein